MSGLSELKLTPTEWYYIALFLEGFFYGIYSGIFCLYLQHQFGKTKKCGDKKPSTIFYSIGILYVFSVFVVWMDVLLFIPAALGRLSDFRYIEFVSQIIQVFSDFIAQSILIYRCWIVWNRNIRIVIIPVFLIVTFLVLSVFNQILTLYISIITSYLQHPWLVIPGWWVAHLALDWTSLTMSPSIVVNALTTGLIVFKIFKVYREVKPLYGQSSGTCSGSKLRPIIFILIESGTALFAIKLAYLVVSLAPTLAAWNARGPIHGIQGMFTGIIPTIIQVRVAMGLSFHDNESMVEATSSLRFGSANLNSNPELDNDLGIAHQENRDGDIGDEQHNHQECRDKDPAVGPSCNLDIVEIQREEHISSARQMHG